MRTITANASISDKELTGDFGMNKVGISILGFGTIGSSVYKILEEQKDFLLSNYGYECTIRYILVKNLKKRRDISENIKIVDDVKYIVNDAETDIVIECVGGNAAEETYENVIKLIKSKKNIVFSSKKCLATYRKEIIKEASENGVQIRYDATVGGGIPTFHLLDNLYGTDRIYKLYGIVNGSTNYILTLMKKKGLDYEAAKKQAIQEGLAENDPHEDVDGIDAMYKLTILLRFGLGYEGEFEKIKPREFSIENTESVYKQIVYAEIDENIKVYVGTTNVKGTVLENINGKTNIICLESQYGGIKSILGVGAGGDETASVMIDDLLDILMHERIIKNISLETKIINIEPAKLRIKKAE